MWIASSTLLFALLPAIALAWTPIAAVQMSIPVRAHGPVMFSSQKAATPKKSRAMAAKPAAKAGDPAKQAAKLRAEFERRTARLSTKRPKVRVAIDDPVKRAAKLRAEFERKNPKKSPPKPTAKVGDPMKQAAKIRAEFERRNAKLKPATKQLPPKKAVRAQSASSAPVPASIAPSPCRPTIGRKETDLEYRKRIANDPTYRKPTASAPAAKRIQPLSDEGPTAVAKAMKRAKKERPESSVEQPSLIVAVLAVPPPMLGAAVLGLLGTGFKIRLAAITPVIVTSKGPLDALPALLLPTLALGVLTVLVLGGGESADAAKATGSESAKATGPEDTDSAEVKGVVTPTKNVPVPDESDAAEAMLGAFEALPDAKEQAAKVGRAE